MSALDATFTSRSERTCFLCHDNQRSSPLCVILSVKRVHKHLIGSDVRPWRILLIWSPVCFGLSRFQGMGLFILFGCRLWIGPDIDADSFGAVMPLRGKRLASLEASRASSGSGRWQRVGIRLARRSDRAI
jgi:hypothetical protein